VESGWVEVCAKSAAAAFLEAFFEDAFADFSFLSLMASVVH
jgi:hypothetical protein